MFWACSASTPAAQIPPRQAASVSPEVETTPPQPPPVASPDRPVDLRIRELVVDPGKTVRIRGIVSSIVGIRLVPPKVIFKITDSVETITVLINEQITLKEGMRIELIGKYKEIPSPAHSGAGEPPREAVFVVERYLDLP